MARIDKLYAVTVCVGRHEGLRHCLRNHLVLDDWVIVTTQDDEDTQLACEDAGVRYIVSERFYEGGYYHELESETKTSKETVWHDSAIFNKGKAINDGMDTLPQEGWHIVLDADIILPKNMRSVFKRSVLKPHQLYGMDRVICPSIDDYKRVTENGWVGVPLYEGLRGADKENFMREHHGKCYLHRPKTSGDGYFQMFSGSKGMRYSESFSSRFADTRGFSQEYWKHTPWHRRKLQDNESGVRSNLTCFHLGNAFEPWKKTEI